MCEKFGASGAFSAFLGSLQTFSLAEKEPLPVNPAGAVTSGTEKERTGKAPVRSTCFSPVATLPKFRRVFLPPPLALRSGIPALRREARVHQRRFHRPS
jgi:hypothetical protein